MYVQEAVLIELQSEANTISLKSETLPIPDETSLLHQATFDSRTKREARETTEKRKELYFEFKRPPEAKKHRSIEA